jgi:hypothetical protein
VWHEFIKERVNASKLVFGELVEPEKAPKNVKRVFVFTVKEEKISSIFL